MNENDYKMVNVQPIKEACSLHEVGSRLDDTERRYLLAKKEEEECRKHINYLRRDLTKLSKIRADLARQYNAAHKSANADLSDERRP